jgi:hypothetical protein
MPLLIPIQPVPSQQLFCVLGGQNCSINIYYKTPGVFVDLNSNGVDICIACIALNAVPLDSCNAYDGFLGNLFFIDTQGSEDPQYTGFGTRWVLIYLTAAELALTAFEPITSVNLINMTLATSLLVTSSAPGNFSIAHGLPNTPVMIEIIPTSPGAIWGQSGFADATNINLAASDTGVTATVLVYSIAPNSIVGQTPSRVINATSVAPGNFTVAHHIGAVPSAIEIVPTSGGVIWAQTPAFDGTNVYLTASDADVSATINVYGPTGSLTLGPILILKAIAPFVGNFPLPYYGLTRLPSRIEIVPLSAGAIWSDEPAFDSQNIYLVGSDIGALAMILVYV